MEISSLARPLQNTEDALPAAVNASLLNATVALRQLLKTAKEEALDLALNVTDEEDAVYRYP